MSIFPHEFLHEDLWVFMSNSWKKSDVSLDLDAFYWSIISLRFEKRYKYLYTRSTHHPVHLGTGSIHHGCGRRIFGLRLSQLLFGKARSGQFRIFSKGGTYSHLADESQTREADTPPDHPRHPQLLAVRWSIRLTRLNLICEHSKNWEVYWDVTGQGPSGHSMWPCVSWSRSRHDPCHLPDGQGHAWEALHVLTIRQMAWIMTQNDRSS